MSRSRLSRLVSSLRSNAGTQTVLVLGLACLLVLAGCSGGGTKPTSTSVTTTQTTSTTQTTQTTTVPTLADVTFPSGVTNESVSLALLKADQQQLSGESVTITHLERYGSGSHYSTVVSVSGSSATQNATYTSSSGSVQNRRSWINASGTYRRSKSSGSVSYSVADRPFNRKTELQSYYYKTYLKTGNFAPTGVVTENGQVLIQLNATKAANPDVLKQYYGASTVKHFSGSALVTQKGVIRSFTVNESYVKGGQTRTRQEHFELSKVGNTTVKRPQWVSQAVEKAVQFNLTFSKNARYLTVSQTNGDQIPAGATIYVRSNKEYRMKLNSTLKTGQTRYLYIQDGSVHLTAKPPASDASVTKLSNSVGFTVYEHGSSAYSKYVNQR